MPFYWNDKQSRIEFRIALEVEPEYFFSFEGATPTFAEGLAMAKALEVFYASGKNAAELAASLADAQAEIARLRGALEVAHDHLDMNSLEVSHCKDAALIRETLRK